MEIAPGIHRIQCNFGGSRMVFVHLLVGDDKSMLVDTGCAHNPQQDILPYMHAHNIALDRLRYIVISHSDLDHQGGNRPMKEAAPNALLACHHLDYPWVSDTEALIHGRYAQFDAKHGFVTTEADKQATRAVTLSHPVEMTLQGGEHFWLSSDWAVEVIHTPGHTWGHLTVYDPRSKTLLSGEAALWNAILDVAWQPVMPPTYCYVDTYLASLDRLLGMEIALMSPAHWQVQRGADVKDFLNESRNYCLFVEKTILDYARQQPNFTLKQAMHALNDTLGRWGEGGRAALPYPMMGNIDSLVKRGILHQAHTADGVMCWKIAGA